MFLDYSSLTRFNESVKYNLEVNISLLVVKYIILILWQSLVATQNQSIEQWMWLYLGQIRQAIDLKHAAEAFSQKNNRYILQPFLFSCKMLLKWQIWEKRKLIKRILIKLHFIYWLFYILIMYIILHFNNFLNFQRANTFSDHNVFEELFYPLSKLTWMSTPWA